jgi:hypothetical protein
MAGVADAKEINVLSYPTPRRAASCLHDGIFA